MSAFAPPRAVERAPGGAAVSRRARAAALCTRIVVAVFASYAAVAGLAGCAAMTLIALGMARSEATLLTSMLGIVLYVALVLWGFATRRLLRTAVVLIASAALSATAALALAGAG